MASGNVLLAYFSGTGGTAKVAEAFNADLLSRGFSVDMQEIKTNKPIPNGNEDLLVILFAVHALNAPLPVYQWLKSINTAHGIPAVVISVSGGGEISPNTACRLSTIKRLEKKGYDIVYEYMLIMPSNMSLATPDFLVKGLFKVLPEKVKNINDEVLSGFRRRTKPKVFDRFLARVLEVEKTGAKQFGKHLSANDDCTGCGLCALGCPGDNIRIKDGRPVFANRCVMCFKCVYGCPSHVIHPKLLGSILNKNGFDINSYEKLEDVPVQKVGITWKAVQKYIDQNGI